MSDLKVDGIISSTGTNTNLTLEGKGTGGVKITDYLIQTKGGDIASDTALTLGKDGNQFDVTGTTTITSIATQGIGSYVTLHFDGALTFTHHSTDLILPGAASITTAAGDIAVMYEYASADWRCVSYTKASGAAVAGGGAWNLIETGVASSSASITLNPISTTYDTYVIMGSDLVPATDDVEAWFRIGDSSGIDSGAGDYSWFVQGKDLNAAATHLYNYSEADTKIALCETGIELTGNQAGEGFGFVLWLHNPSDSTMRPSVSFVSTMSNQGTNYAGWHGGGHREAVLTITQVQFLFQSGNIATGRCSLYGIAHA